MLCVLYCLNQAPRWLFDRVSLRLYICMYISLWSINRLIVRINRKIELNYILDQTIPVNVIRPVQSKLYEINNNRIIIHLTLKYCIELSSDIIWDYCTETGHLPVTSINELFETLGASRAIVMHIKLYHDSKSSGTSSLCWGGRGRGKHGNCRGHSAFKWSARWEPAPQIPQISEHAPFDLYGETH